jgi:hypothetical protein
LIRNQINSQVFSEEKRVIDNNRLCRFHGKYYFCVKLLTNKLIRHVKD